MYHMAVSHGLYTCVWHRATYSWLPTAPYPREGVHCMFMHMACAVGRGAEGCGCCAAAVCCTAQVLAAPVFDCIYIAWLALCECICVTRRYLLPCVAGALLLPRAGCLMLPCLLGWSCVSPRLRHICSKRLVVLPVCLPLSGLHVGSVCHTINGRCVADTAAHCLVAMPRVAYTISGPATRVCCIHFCLAAAKHCPAAAKSWEEEEEEW